MYLFSEDWILNSSCGPYSDPQIGAKLQEMKDVAPRDDPLNLTVYHHRHVRNAFVCELSRYLIAVIVRLNFMMTNPATSACVFL